MAYPNRLGVRGWAAGGRWGLERWLYTLHRASGLALLLYFLLHLFVTAARAFGPAAWAASMGRVEGLAFELGELLVFAAFAFHGANGLRLVAVELGHLVGRPIEPVYPYPTSVGRQRRWSVAALAAAAGLVAWAGTDLFFH